MDSSTEKDMPSLKEVLTVARTSQQWLALVLDITNYIGV